jgi:acid phosphatase family membrane protein YuiD
MTTRIWTLIFMAITLVSIAVYDTMMAINDVDGDTISEITLKWAMGHPIAVVCFGIALGTLLGHLFWPQFISK